MTYENRMRHRVFAADLLAFTGGFVTCAILCFSREDEAPAVTPTEIDEHA